MPKVVPVVVQEFSVLHEEHVISFPEKFLTSYPLQALHT